MQRLITILLCLTLTLGAYAQRRALTLSDSASIYLLTCTPGTEVWSKYGHTGLRVEDKPSQIDMVFNYGVFSLTSDDFYLKFVQGNTYYQLGIESYEEFKSFYGEWGRKTYWQELNLTTSQKQSIFEALVENYRPENRKYLYNFVFDNCATRPYYLLKEAIGDSIVSEYTGYCQHTYREAISHYTRPNSWVDFGINLIFGEKANAAMSSEQRLFLPEELMFYIAEAKFADGTSLVKNQDIAAFEIEKVDWYANCWIGIGVFAILMLLISLWDRHRSRLSWWVDVLFCVVYLVLVSVVIFLTFYSSHPLVGFNWRLLLLPIIHLCARFIYWLR